MEESKPISTLVAEAVYAMEHGTRTPYPEPPRPRPYVYDFSRYYIDINEDSGLDDFITSKPDDDGEHLIFNVYRRDFILTPEGSVTKVNVTRSVAIRNIPENQLEIDKLRASADSSKESLKRTLQLEALEELQTDEEKKKKMKSRKERIMRDPMSWKGPCTVKKGRQSPTGSREKIRKIN